MEEHTGNIGNNQGIHTETVIAGAGPAGLAVGACLRMKGHPFVMLEKSDRVGAAWHRHYDRLHLHTDKNRSELPYLSYPDHFPKYPSRLQVIEYLNGYARRFDLLPRFNQAVISAEFRDGHWYTRTRNHRYVSRNLVIATGFNNKPHIPDWPGMESFTGKMVHSSEYRNGEPFQEKKVLVVGFGNSGGEIAIDLCEYGAGVALSVRSPVNIIPRDLLGLPILAIAVPLSKLPARLVDALTAPVIRLIFGDIGRLGLRKRNDGPFGQIQNRQRIPLIDVGTIELIREGKIEVYPGIERLTNKKVVFTDGTRRRFDAVVLATGYQPGVESFFKDGSLEIEEQPLPFSRDRNSLYFCGFYVSPTGVLRDISIEAKQIARAIVNKESDVV